MKKISLLLILITSIIFTGCNSTKTTDKCPTCNMKTTEMQLHTSSLHVDNINYIFDDIGCMILFAKNRKIDLNKVRSQVFTLDTNRYIDSSKANYTDSENTPMGYGFTAYEKEIDMKTIKFSEVIVKMLIGDHMAN